MSISSPQTRPAMVNVLVGKCHVWGLVDSGADFSVIREDIANSYAREKSLVIGPATRSAVAAGGETLDIGGSLSVELMIKDKGFRHEMAVSKNIIYDVILGRDFCCKVGLVLDDRQAVIRIDEMVIPLPTYEEVRPARARVRVGEAVVIPSRSKCMAMARVEPVHGTWGALSRTRIEGLVEPNQKTFQEGIAMPRVVSLVAFKDGTGSVPIQLINMGEEDAKILKGTDVGTFHVTDGGAGTSYQICEGGEKGIIASCQEHGEIPPGINIEDCSLSDTGKDKLRSLLKGYSSVFSQGSGDLGKTHLVQHYIDTGDAPPVKQRPRRIPLNLRDQVEHQKQQMLDDGIIEECDSPWCSPIVMVKRGDGSFRFCVDLRQVNGLTQSMAYPLPRVDDALDSLCGAQFFSTLDMASGYWQVELTDESKAKTAFSTGKGQQQFKVLPFGLKNSGPTFQKLMELVLAGMDAKTCLVYVDDIILFNKTEEEHLKTVAEVLQKISQANLKLKPSKCHFGCKEVVFLGHRVSAEGILPDPGNVEKVRKWPEPETGADLGSFIGLCGYYQRFIPKFAEETRLLREAASAAGKGTLRWTATLSSAFARLKELLTTAPVLGMPTFEGTFRLETDASDAAVGAVLSEVTQTGSRVVAYASSVLSKAQRKWATYDKELWAILWSIRKFRQYIAGASFLVVTDHKPLTNLPQSVQVERDATGRRGRWALELSSYEFTVMHRKGSDHANADAMSRIPRDKNESKGRDEENPWPDLDEERDAGVIGAAVPVYDPGFQDDGGLLQEVDIRSAQQNDPVLGVVREWVRREELPKPKEWKTKIPEAKAYARIFPSLEIRGGLLGVQRRWNGNMGFRVIIPESLRRDVLKLSHDQNTAGHLGVDRTMERVLRRCYWPRIYSDVRDYCESCTQCQRRGRPTPLWRAPLQEEPLALPFERVALDITEMPMSSSGHRYALVLMDYFTKWVKIYPMKDQTSESVAEGLLEWTYQHGVPKRLHSDQGRQFESRMFKTLCERLGIDKTRTSQNP